MTGKNIFKRVAGNMLLCMAVVCFTNISCTGQSVPGKAEYEFLSVTNPRIPDKINFAGSSVSLDRIDMAERFDRELTSLIYSHGNTLLTIKRANRYYPVIVPILKKYNIPEDFFYLAAVESHFDLRAYSPAKAAGIWQFIPATAKEYGLEVDTEVDERYDPEKATVAACLYFRKAYERYGDWASVMASYNGGMGRISKELVRQNCTTFFDLYLAEETTRYVYRIMAMKMILEDYKLFGFNLEPEQLYQPVRYKNVEVSGSVENWADWGRQYGVTYAQLREMNPWIRRITLTNKKGKTYTVKIPLKEDLYRSSRQFKTYKIQSVAD